MMEIPKLIHLTWYGGKRIPTDYRKNMDRWIDLTLGTEWQVKFHMDIEPEIKQFRKLFIERGATPVQVSNIMRFYHLYTSGGLYADIDIIPIRLPRFTHLNLLNVFQETGADKLPKVCNSVMAAPPSHPKVLELFFWCLQNTPFENETLETHLKAGGDLFTYFSDDWFDSVMIRGVNHYSPVSWQDARVLNIAQKYTHSQWVELAESYADNPDVYGVHTYDSRWVYELNERQIDATY